MTTYYRIHDTGRCSPEDLLRPEHQVSRVWWGVMYRRCDDCDGTGSVWDAHVEDHVTCVPCRGDGEEQIDTQPGVSVCRSLPALRAYLAERSPYTDGCVVVELEGEELDERDVDAEHGALLVRPTRIVRVLSVECLA